MKNTKDGTFLRWFRRVFRNLSKNSLKISKNVLAYFAKFCKKHALHFCAFGRNTNVWENFKIILKTLEEKSGSNQVPASGGQEYAYRGTRGQQLQSLVQSSYQYGGAANIESFPFHLVHSGQSLMGIDLFNALDLQILAPDGEPVNTLQHKSQSKGKHFTFDTTVDASAALECNSASSATNFRAPESDECRTSSSYPVPRTTTFLEHSRQPPLLATYTEVCIVDGSRSIEGYYSSTIRATSGPKYCDLHPPPRRDVLFSLAHTFLRTTRTSI